MLELMCALACGPLDRLRGHEAHLFGKRIFDKIVFGACLMVAGGFYVDPLIAFCVTVAMILGMSPGWGEPIAAILEKREMRKDHAEWWQVGRLKEDPWTALAVRGLIWGAPAAVVAVAFFDPWIAIYIPVMMVAMPLGMLGAKIPFLGKDIWGRMEFTRGWIAGGLLLLSTFFR